MLRRVLCPDSAMMQTAVPPPPMLLSPAAPPLPYGLPLAFSLPSPTGSPLAAAKLPPARVTEADRVAWMRQFLAALEQWKTCVDALHAAPEVLVTSQPEVSAPPLPPLLPAPPMASGPSPGASSTAPAATGDQGAQHSMAVYAATAQAQQAQYLQQFQFWQQMRAHEAQRTAGRAAGAAATAASALSQSSTRFKDNFRPMRFCKHLVTMGFCRQGETCTFAHTFEELHLSSPDLPRLDAQGSTSALAELSALSSSVTAAGDPNALPDLRLKKKKELCGRFMRGHCSLGKVCSFAHGEDELNTVGLAVCGKVKTQLCRNWEVGRCHYGANCNNAHGELEIGTKRPPPELAPPSKRRKEDEERRRDDEQQGPDEEAAGDAGAGPADGPRSHAPGSSTSAALSPPLLAAPVSGPLGLPGGLLIPAPPGAA